MKNMGIIITTVLVQSSCHLQPIPVHVTPIGYPRYRVLRSCESFSVSGPGGLMLFLKARKKMFLQRTNTSSQINPTCYWCCAGAAAKILALLKQLQARRVRASIGRLAMGLGFIALLGYNHGKSQGLTPAAQTKRTKLLEWPPREVETASETSGENSAAHRTDNGADVDHAPIGNATEPRPSTSLGGGGDAIQTSSLSSYCQMYLKFGGSSEVRYVACCSQAQRMFWF